MVRVGSEGEYEMNGAYPTKYANMPKNLLVGMILFLIIAGIIAIIPKELLFAWTPNVNITYTTGNIDQLCYRCIENITTTCWWENKFNGSVVVFLNLSMSGFPPETRYLECENMSWVECKGTLDRYYNYTFPPCLTITTEVK